MPTKCFMLGYDDGYANRPAKSQAPEYRDGYATGRDERYHEERYWGEQATLDYWEGLGR